MPIHYKEWMRLLSQSITTEHGQKSAKVMLALKVQQEFTL